MTYNIIYGVSFLDDLHNYFPDFLYNNSRFTNVQDVFSYMNQMVESRFNLYNYGMSVYQTQYPRAGVVRTRQSAPTMTTNVRTNTAANTTENTATYITSTNSENQQQRRGPVQIVANLRIVPAALAPAAAPAATPAAAPAATPADISGHEIPNERTSLITATYSVFPQLNRDVEEISIEGMLPSFLLGQGPLIGRNTVNLNGIRDNTLESNQAEQLLNDFFLNPQLNYSPLSTFFNSLLPPRQNNNWLDPVIVRPTATEIARATTLTTILNEQDVELCVICQDDINYTQTVRTINHCGHKFHQICLDAHFQNSVRCPICRHDIRQSQDQENTSTSS
jgi:hypothetical protein